MSSYVIRTLLRPQSYYQQMTAMGPMFGAMTTELARRFSSAMAADAEMNGWPLVASVGSVVVPLCDKCGAEFWVGAPDREPDVDEICDGRCEVDLDI